MNALCILLILAWLPAALGAAAPALVPGDPTPVSGALDAPLHPTFEWVGDAPAYNVFFGETPERLEFRGSTRVPNTYNNVFIPALRPRTKYHWRVEGVDRGGRRVVLGPVWSFTTGSGTAAPVVDRADAPDPGPYLARFSDWSIPPCWPHMDRPRTFFKMSIESAAAGPERAVVTTTGAIYVVDGRGIGLWRRIDPATNTVRPRLVAALDFDEDIGPLTLDAGGSDSVTLRGRKLELVFQTDSLFFLKARAPIACRHRNLIARAAWNKGAGANRIWTDGYGGSLHAGIDGAAAVRSSTRDGTAFELESGDVTAHMAFPPRPFDFESLYGREARPHAHFVYGRRALDALLEPGAMDPFVKDGFGLFVLFAQVYPDAEAPEYDRVRDRIFYRIDPGCAASLRRFVDGAHARGFKVIPYLSYPAGPRWNYPEGARKGVHQDVSVTLQAMREFQAEHRFDGWYFDNANVGELRADYEFIRQVRRDVGERGVIYHHDSVDVWDQWLEYSGLRAIMIDAYVDYTLTGETGPPAQVDHPNEEYMRFFSSGYGLHQAFGSHKRVSLMNLALSEPEKLRLMAQNLNGSERTRTPAWTEHFLPAFELRKRQYLSGRFRPDVDWPLDPEKSWYRTPKNVRVESIAGGARIHWETDRPADSEVAYTGTGVWWPHGYTRRPAGPDGRVRDDRLTQVHTLELKGLNPGHYEFKILSSNRARGTDEILWGIVGGFTASPDGK